MLSGPYHGAGIRSFVVTGDHPATSVAIAAQASIISNIKTIHKFSNLSLDPDKKDTQAKFEPSSVPGLDPPRSIAITGVEIDAPTKSQMDQLREYTEIVFARTTPEQKLRIVQAFRACGLVVAMTGDGVNDAPSLREADCGTAMGSGSDVAREAADMVILQDFSATLGE